METGVWVPAFAGMTEGRDYGVGPAGRVWVREWAIFVAMSGWWVMETGVWVPAFAGMTEVAGITGWRARDGGVAALEFLDGY